MDSAWSVPRAWAGETAYLIGGGPSLKPYISTLAGLLSGRRVIAINNSWELCPEADIVYAMDRSWWEQHGERVKREFRGRPGGERWMITLSKSLKDPEVLRLAHAGKDRGLSQNPRELCSGSHSGYQAINLAYLLGARRIVLLGYDYRVAGSPWTDAEGCHYHGIHPGQNAVAFASRTLPGFLKALRCLRDPLAAAGVEVCNARPPVDPVGSAIDWWPRVGIEEAVAEGDRRQEPGDSPVGFASADLRETGDRE